MHSNGEYILDFVIPAGPTGPTGFSSLCYIKFDDTTSIGNVAIDTNIILPTSCNKYVLTSNTICINKPVYY